MEKKVTSPLTKGLIIALILVVIDLFGWFTHINFESWWRWTTTLILCIAVIWACINYANQKDNLVTFGNVFGHGFKTSAVIAGIMFLYILLSIFVIFPEAKDLALDQARKQIEAKGNLSQDQIDQALEISKKFIVPGIIIGA